MRGRTYVEREVGVRASDVVLRRALVLPAVSRLRVLKQQKTCGSDAPQT